MLYSFKDKHRSNVLYNEGSSSSEEESGDKTSTNDTSEINEYSFDYLTNGCTACYRYYSNL